MASKISVLVAARKDSKFLAKFIHGYLMRTADLKNTELLIMVNKNDTWNEELRHLYKKAFNWYSEDYGLGRAGLHKYLNDLVPHATGDWIIYFCEDHFIVGDSWDVKVRSFIADRELDPKKIYSIIPKFDNCGAMNQILSRGYVDTMGGVLGRHGWIDSYINELNGKVFGDHSERVLRMDQELFHDFTHDQPNPMSDAAMQSVITLDARKLPKFEDQEVRDLIGWDAELLQEALRDGR